MKIDYDAIAAAGGLGKGESAADRRDRLRVERERNWRHLCAAVDQRDGKQCRVCGSFTNPEAISQRGERHHIVPKSLGGGDFLANVLTLCYDCHQGRGGTHGLTKAMRLSGDANLRDKVSGRLIGVKVERLEGDVWAVWKWI